MFILQLILIFLVATFLLKLFMTKDLFKFLSLNLGLVFFIVLPILVNPLTILIVVICMRMSRAIH